MAGIGKAALDDQNIETLLGLLLRLWFLYQAALEHVDPRFYGIDHHVQLRDIHSESAGGSRFLVQPVEQLIALVERALSQGNSLFAVCEDRFDHQDHSLTTLVADFENVLQLPLNGTLTFMSVMLDSERTELH